MGKNSIMIALAVIFCMAMSVESEARGGSHSRRGGLSR